MGSDTGEEVEGNGCWKGNLAITFPVFLISINHVSLRLTLNNLTKIGDIESSQP